MNRQAETEEASYEYSSSETTEESSGDIAEYEREYFGDVSEESVQEDAAVWEDSEDEERIRSDYKKTATWLDGKQPKKQLEIRRKRLRFDYDRFLFLSKCNIKLSKSYGEHLVVVDTYNIVYILKHLKPHRAFQIEKFGVSDLAFINGAILFASCRQSSFREVSFDGEMKIIHNRAAENTRKLVCVEDALYVVGDHLALLSNSYDVLEVFETRFKDIAVSAENVYALDFSGQIFVLSRNLQVLRKISLDDKFDFRSIHFARNMVVVGTGTGVQMFDAQMNAVKRFTNTKDEIVDCIECGEYIVYGSAHADSIRIVQPGMVCFDRFPFSSIRIPSIRTMSYDGENIIICSGRAVNALRMHLE